MLYVPSSFAVADAPAMHTLIRSNGFATLIAPDAADPWISHLPLLLDATRGEQGVLVGHIARANAHWQRFIERPEALAIFHGPHAYVSPSLYQAHPSVPTWNYAVVHVHGLVRLIDDPERLEAMLRVMVGHYERSRDPRWFMALPEDYLATMLRGIVGIELVITRLTGKFKLSQNRPASDRRAVTEAFEAGDAGERAVAAWMKLHAPYNATEP